MQRLRTNGTFPSRSPSPEADAPLATAENHLGRESYIRHGPKSSSASSDDRAVHPPAHPACPENPRFAVTFESRMGLEAIHPGSAANPVAMRGLQVCAGILPPQARARTCTLNSAKARLVHSPVHIPEQERLSRGTGPWSRTLPSPRHGRRGQFVTYPHCEINCGGGDRRMSRRVGARGGRRRASASPACGDPTPGNGEGASARRKELFDEEPGGDVQPLSVHVGRDREDLCRCRETELVREESHVVLVVARAVREHLHREQ